MTGYRLIVWPPAEDDVAAALEWYEKERPGLGAELLQSLRSSFDRIVLHPLAYRHLRDGVRRAVLRRFPYEVFYFIDEERVVVMAVLHSGRDPAEWQRRKP